MRQITIRYEGECRRCGNGLKIGQPAFYEKSMGCFCIGCEPKDTEEISHYRKLRAEKKAERLINKASRVYDFCFGNGTIVSIHKKSCRIKFDQSGSTWARDKSFIRAL